MVSKTENLEYKIVAERDHAPPWLLAVSQSYPYTPPEIPSYSQTDHNGQNESQPDPHLDELHTFHECRESYCGPRQNDRHDNGPRPDKQHVFDPPALRKSRKPRNTNIIKQIVIDVGPNHTGLHSALCIRGATRYVKNATGIILRLNIKAWKIAELYSLIFLVLTSSSV